MDPRLSWIEWLWFPQGAHLILLTGVCFYASPGPSDSVPHLVLHGPSDSGPHPGITGIWILYTPHEPHFVQGPLVPFWASNKMVTMVPPLGLTLTWWLWSPLGVHLGLVSGP